MAGSRNSIFNFEEPPGRLRSTVLSSAPVHEGSNFFTSLPTLVICVLGFVFINSLSIPCNKIKNGSI